MNHDEPLPLTHPALITAPDGSPLFHVLTFADVPETLSRPATIDDVYALLAILADRPNFPDMLLADYEEQLG